MKLMIIPDVANYMAGSDGQIYSTKNRWGQRPNPCLVRSWPDRDGYRRVTIVVDGRRKNIAVHRLIAKAFLGLPPTARHEAQHKDGTRTNNIPSNLKWGLQKENADDRECDGRTARGDRQGARLHPETLQRGSDHWANRRPDDVLRGERHGNAKLTAAVVCAIRASSAATVVLAAKFGVSRSLIVQVRSRKIWVHV
jgi:hypothetical protein